MKMKIRILSEDLADKAKSELNEDPRTIHEEIRNLKEWLVKQPHLRARQDDQWLVGFIRGCKHSLEKAKQKIDLYYTIRTLTPELSRIDLEDPSFRHIFESGSCLPLQTLDASGARIILSRVGTYDPTVYHIHDAVKVLCATAELVLMEDDDAVVSGVTFIWDCNAAKLTSASQITPSLIRKAIALFVESMPLRAKSIHILNTPSFFEPIFNLAKPLLSAKIRNRFFVHGRKLDSFYKAVPKDHLPLEYGGSASSIEELKKHLINKLEQYNDWFSKDEKYGTDENQRLGSPSTLESLFGMAGSFRQLNVD